MFKYACILEGFFVSDFFWEFLRGVSKGLLAPESYLTPKSPKGSAVLLSVCPFICQTSFNNYNVCLSHCTLSEMNGMLCVLH